MSAVSPAEYEARIRALERMNATLAAEVDRMRPVVEAAIIHLRNPDKVEVVKRDRELWTAVIAYQAFGE